MEIAKVKVKQLSLEIDLKQEIPCGILGAQVRFEFDTSWQGLSKTVVFKGCCTKDVLMVGETVTIPAEVVADPGVKLEMGIYGTNADNSVAIPTLWADLGSVRYATEPSGDTSTNPTLPVWAQIRAMIGDLDALDTEGKENLVAAVNEALTKCGKDGYTPARGVDYWTDDDKAEVVAETSHAVLETVSKSSDIVCAASGDVISLTDVPIRELQGLKFYGKTTQKAVPTPDVPVAMESVGDGGSITVTVGTTETDENPQTLVVSMSNGLPGIPVSGGGNYTDANGQQWASDCKDYAGLKYVQSVISVTFDGSDDETWELSGTRFQTYATGIQFPGTSSDKAPMLCNRYTPTTANYTYSGTIGVSMQSWGARVAIQFRDDTFADLSAWKTNLAKNPITCMFALVTPIETDLTDEEIPAYFSLHTNKPSTTISNDAGAGMEVAYVADAKTYIDNKFAELSAAILNNT